MTVLDFDNVFDVNEILDVDNVFDVAFGVDFDGIFGFFPPTYEVHCLLRTREDDIIIMFRNKLYLRQYFTPSSSFELESLYYVSMGGLYINSVFIIFSAHF